MAAMGAARPGRGPRAGMVDAIPINVLLAHIKAERVHRVLLGTDESDDLARLVAESILERAVETLGERASFKSLLSCF